MAMNHESKNRCGQERKKMRHWFRQLFGWFDFANLTREEFIEKIHSLAIWLWIFLIPVFYFIKLPNASLWHKILSFLFFFILGVIGLTIVLLKNSDVLIRPLRKLPGAIIGAFLTLAGFGLAIFGLIAIFSH
jgi:hypothetical protein